MNVLDHPGVLTFPPKSMQMLGNVRKYLKMLGKCLEMPRNVGKMFGNARECWKNVWKCQGMLGKCLEMSENVGKMFGNARECWENVVRKMLSVNVSASSARDHFLCISYYYFLFLDDSILNFIEILFLFLVFNPFYQ